MEPVILCVGKYSECPYIFEDFGIKVHSIEEVCYFIYENSYLIDETILKQGLIEWIDYNCNLQVLATALNQNMGKKNGLFLFAKMLFEFTGFYNEKEIEIVENVLLAQYETSIYEKHMRQAEFALQRGKCKLAIQIYERILVNVEELSIEASARLCHNYGVCKVKMFQFEQAATAFLKAYSLQPKEESYVQYLVAKRLSLTENEYIQLVHENPDTYEYSLQVEDILGKELQEWKVSKEFFQFDKIRKARNVGEQEIYKQQINDLIIKIKNSY